MERFKGGPEEAWLWDDGRPKQGLFIARGIALKRNVTPQGSINLQVLFLERGLCWVKLPGAAKGSKRFGGAVEPLVLGEYYIRSSPRGLYVESVDVKEDFLNLRANRKGLQQGLEFASDLSRYQLSGYPCDNVVKALYWSLKALADGVDPSWVALRFYWRWFNDLGIQPNIEDLHRQLSWLPEELGQSVKRFVTAKEILPQAPNEKINQLAQWMRKQLET